LLVRVVLLLDRLHKRALAHSDGLRPFGLFNFKVWDKSQVGSLAYANVRENLMEAVDNCVEKFAEAYACVTRGIDEWLAYGIDGYRNRMGSR
jgi:hypothetical protein